MRGTGYAVAEIIFWMLAAAVIGAIIGWLLGRWSMRKRAADECEARLRGERRRLAADCQAKVEELEAAVIGGSRHDEPY